MYEGAFCKLERERGVLHLYWRGKPAELSSSSCLFIRADDDTVLPAKERRREKELEEFDITSVAI